MKQHKWKPGQSGNPSGRPKGIPDKRTQWRKAIEDRGDDLIKRAVELALEGDTQALRLCLERAVPAYKPKSEAVEFELSGESLTERAESILTAISEGKLDPATGQSLIAATAQLAKLVEIDEIERRVAALEGDNEENT